MSEKNKLSLFKWPESLPESKYTSQRESDNYILNVEDFLEIQELLNVFFYKKERELDFADMLNLEKFPHTKQRLKDEIWDYLKVIYFKEESI